MVNREDAPDAAEFRPFQVEAHRLALSCFRVAGRLGVGRVDTLTLSALVALAAGAGVARLSLLLG